MHCAAPEVDPHAEGYVDFPLCSTLVQNRRDQDVRPKEVFVAQIEHAQIMRKLQHQRAHERDASGARLRDRRVDVWQQTIAQTEVFAADRFDLSAKLPGLT